MILAITTSVIRNTNKDDDDHDSEDHTDGVGDGDKKAYKYRKKKLTTTVNMKIKVSIVMKTVYQVGRPVTRHRLTLFLLSLSLRLYVCVRMYYISFVLS